MKIGIYDCETRADAYKVGWTNYKALGLSAACVNVIEGDDPLSNIKSGKVLYMLNSIKVTHIPILLKNTLEVEKWKQDHNAKLKILEELEIKIDGPIVDEWIEQGDLKVSKKTFLDPLNLVKELNSCDLVIGFNNNHFDDNLVCALAGKDQEFILHSKDIQKDIDSITDIKYIAGLDRLARATLNESKTAGVDGSKVWELWKEFELETIIKYCQQDTDITTKLLLFGIQHGYVLTNPNKNEDLFGNLFLKIPVNWDRFLK